MNLGVNVLAFAGGQAGGLSMFIVPVLLIGMLYFMLIRPQKKQEKKMDELRKSMQVGDHVVTIGGIIGRVVNLRETEVTISTSVAGTMMTFQRNAISQVIKAQAETEAEEKTEK